jgi:hypothetical protein
VAVLVRVAVVPAGVEQVQQVLQTLALMEPQAVPVHYHQFLVQVLRMPEEVAVAVAELLELVVPVVLVAAAQEVAMESTQLQVL